jgi:hypothetical protein
MRARVHLLFDSHIERATLFGSGQWSHHLLHAGKDLSTSLHPLLDILDWLNGAGAIAEEQ